MNNEALNKIYAKLQSVPDHILMGRYNTHYFVDFATTLDQLIETASLSSNKLLEHMYLTKLWMQKPFSINKYLQGVSELLFWIYAVQKHYSFDVDKKLSSDNDTDVDIQIRHEGYTFNIEVKCPDQREESANTLYLCPAYRFQLSKENLNREIAGLQSLINPALESNTSKYESTKVMKIDDNKVIEYLRSAQRKFQYDSSLNILVISVSSEMMQSIWGYLYNPQSGIFTRKLSEQFRNKDGSPMMHSDFDKVDVVLLTNIVSGHKVDVSFNAWNLENYCNIFFRNPYSKAGDSKSEQLKHFLKLLPNEVNRFEDERIKAIKRDRESKIDLLTDDLYLFEFLTRHYPLLCKTFTKSENAEESSK